MKDQTLKHLNTLLEEYEKGKSQLEIELLNDELKENERLEMNSNLEEIAIKVAEVIECVEYISKLPNNLHFLDISGAESFRINPYFIIEFKGKLEEAGLTKKFEEQIHLKKFPQYINLENISSYENKDYWNEFLNIVDFYYPGILVECYPGIPFQNYVTKVSK